MLGHLLNNIISLQIKAAKSQHNQKLTSNAIVEFKSCQKKLKKAHQGVSINNIVFRKPNLICIGNSSEHGLGGINVQIGNLCRFLIPEHLRGRDLSEFLIQVVSIWVDIMGGNSNKHDYSLCMDDNITAASW